TISLCAVIARPGVLRYAFGSADRPCGGHAHRTIQYCFGEILMSRALSGSVRAGLAVASMALLVTACGKKEEAQQGQASGAAGQEEKILHVYNWSDYIAEDTIQNFEAKTGIKVTYDVFDSNDMLETRLLAGNSGFDVVVPSASFLERQIKA